MTTTHLIGYALITAFALGWMTATLIYQQLLLRKPRAAYGRRIDR